MEHSEDRVETLFLEAARHPAGPARERFLDEACAGDSELRQRICELLAVHEEQDGFLEPDSGPLASLSRSSVRPGRVIGRYELLEELGEGGFGVVYLARQREPVARTVALKIIKPGMDSRQVIARFEAERQALAMMDHPAIAKVLDGGTTEAGYPYFVMELVRGERITDYCDRERLSIEQRLELMIEICRAVQHAHQKGIIHRDLKPSNILVTQVDGAAAPKVIDFGIAKTLEGSPDGDSHFTRPGQFVGTPAYMSPEQSRMTGQDIDTRSDVYSLGVLLYELLTGRTPCGKNGLIPEGVEALRQVLEQQEPPRPSNRFAELQPAELRETAALRRSDPAKLEGILAGDLDWIVMKSLEADRSRRYESANDLAVELRRFLDKEPVLARPPSDLYRLRKLVERHKLAFAATGAVLVSLAIGLGVSTWLWNQERDAHWRAVSAEHATSQALGQAVAAVRETKTALAWSDFLQAGRLADAGQDADALAYLARSISENPANQAAGIRLLTLLAYNSWMKPRLTLKTSEPILNAWFSPDSSQVLLGLTDGSSLFWDLKSGRRTIGAPSQTSGIIATICSPDQTCFVTTSWDQTARAWDSKTGRPLAEPMKHGGAVLCATFSPDGKSLATGSADRGARVWSLETGLLLAGPMLHQASVKDVQFSPDGDRIVTASEDSTSVIWDAHGGKMVAGPLRHGSWVNSARFSPDGQLVATASADHTARIWDAGTGEPKTAPLKHGHSVVGARFSPDGHSVVTASLDTTARVWDALTGEQRIPALEHGGPVAMADFTPDGEGLLTTSGDHYAQLWDPRTGKRTVEPLRHYGTVKTARFSNDGRHLLTVAGDEVRVCDEPRLAALPVLVKEGVFTQKASFTRDGGRLVTASADLTAQVFDAHTGQPIGLPMRHGGLVTSARFSPDARWILTASMDRTARLWNARDGSPSGQPLEHGGQVNSAEFSPDGRMVVTASHDATARVWDIDTGKPTGTPLKHDGFVLSARFSPDSQQVLTCSSDGTARIWNARTGQVLAEPMRHAQQVDWAQFSSDGARVVTASGDRTARVWDARTGRALGTPLVHGLQVISAEFNASGTQVLTACQDGKIRLWDVATGRTLVEPYNQGCTSQPHFSPGDRLIGSAGSDGWLRLLDARTLQPVAKALKQEGMDETVAFSPDGRRIASTGTGAWVWDVPLGRDRCPAWLGLLAEAVSGVVLDKQGVLLKSSRDPAQLLEEISAKLAASDPEDDWAVWGRWFVTPLQKRPVSPHSQQTLSGYIAARVAHGGESSLSEAHRLAVGNPDLLALIPAQDTPNTSGIRETPNAQNAKGGAMVVYDGQLGDGWDDYSWCEVNFNSPAPGHPGTNSIAVRAGPWQAIYLHHASFNPTNYDRLAFWLHGGQSDKRLVLQGTIRQIPQPYVPVTIPGNVWTRVVQPLATLSVGGDPGFDGFWLQDFTGTNQGEFYIERIELLPP